MSEKQKHTPEQLESLLWRIIDELGDRKLPDKHGDLEAAIVDARAALSKVQP